MKFPLNVSMILALYTIIFEVGRQFKDRKCPLEIKDPIYSTLPAYFMYMFCTDFMIFIFVKGLPG